MPRTLEEIAEDIAAGQGTVEDHEELAQHKRRWNRCPGLLDTPAADDWTDLPDEDE